MNRRVTCTVLSAVTLCALFAGCGGTASARLVNTEKLSLTGVNSIEVSYISESVTVYEGGNGQLVVKEYMSEDKAAYYAQTDLSGGTLVVKTGERPVINAFSSYIEVYLPASYTGSLIINTTSGNITSNSKYTLSALHARSTSGAIEAGNTQADEFVLSTKSGNITGSSLAGDLRIETTSGMVRLSGMSGAANIKTDSSNIELEYRDVDGDIVALSKSGAIDLRLPSGLAFYFTAGTGSGAIDVSYDGLRSITEKSVMGTIGEDAAVSVHLTTTSGGITAS